MEQRDKRAEQEEQQNTCVDKFLKWFNDCHGTTYTAIRTNRFFANLPKENWDFVAQQRGASDWIALEVKEITVDSFHVVPHIWRKVIIKVNKNVNGKLKGTYGIDVFPNLRIKPKEQKELVQAITDIIIAKNSEIVANPLTDIWPDVRSQLVHWPANIIGMAFSSVTKTGIVPAMLRIHKVSDSGSEVHISQSTSSEVTDREERQAIIDLLGPKKDGKIKHNTQLHVAKQYGTKRTFFLIDAAIIRPEDVRFIKYVLASQKSSLMSDIDQAFIVGWNGEVWEVWPVRIPRNVAWLYVHLKTIMS